MDAIEFFFRMVRWPMPFSLVSPEQNDSSQSRLPVSQHPEALAADREGSHLFLRHHFLLDNYWIACTRAYEDGKEEEVAGIGHPSEYHRNVAELTEAG